MDASQFIAQWLDADGGELAQAKSFLVDLCRVLGVAEPEKTRGVAPKDRSYFESDAVFTHPSGRVGKIDLYKPRCFLLEAKQGVGRSATGRDRRRGIGPRESDAWHNAMHDARGQALGYVETLPERPPFLIVCDVGYCFDLYASFDGSGFYRPFPDGRSFRHYLARFDHHLERFRAIWRDPFSLDPSTRSVRVTTEVAGRVAHLALDLGRDGRWSRRAVAGFLMRSIFTMFAQDVGLLPERLFTRELERWVDFPESFRSGLAELWGAMVHGGRHWTGERLRCFGGWLFAERPVLPLGKGQIELLLEAARHDWSEVEPAIFGTLLEQALDPDERHARGAHYTPRTYVDRLVRPTVEEPLRREWELVRGQVREAVSRGQTAEAERLLVGFHGRLASVRVLDPACGSGNFLYVALDVLKRLEAEVLGRLGELGRGSSERLELPGVTVTPDQLLGIETEPWAGALAELVLWVGYLQWQIRALGGPASVREPVLGEGRSVARRDALLAWSGLGFEEDDDGGQRLEWDRQSFVPHPLTGEPVPDAAATRHVERYETPRRAAWPAAEFVVGNPPFLGNKRMRRVLGDGYVEALRSVYPEVPASADLCMFWWHRAAELLTLPAAAGGARRFGFITTNSITQPFNRRVVERALEGDPPVRLQFAIPDHPWIDHEDGAAVRIAMSVAVRTVPFERPPRRPRASTDDRDEPTLLARLTDPEVPEPPEPSDDSAAWVLIEGQRIHADLSVGPDLTAARPLAANGGLAGQGVKLVGEFDGEGLDRTIQNPATGAPVVRPLLSARRLLQSSFGDREDRLVIDFAGTSEDEAAALHPEAFERVLARVKPYRDQNRRRSIRELWWRFGWERPVLRKALAGLERYVATPSVAKHRLFVFLPAHLLPDGSLFAIATDDPFVLGVLSSRVHGIWAAAAGGGLGDANTPTWTSSACFEPFPFPHAVGARRQAIAELGERIEHHRTERLAAEPELTLTGLYNAVEAEAGRTEMTDELRHLHRLGRVGWLLRLHERLDREVLAAYELPADLAPGREAAVLERLVELGARRAAAEELGEVLWLRPALQSSPTDRRAAAPRSVQPSLPSLFPPVGGSFTARPPAWPGGLDDRLAAVWHLLEHADGQGAGRTTEEVARSFYRARRKSVESVLESLSGLGLAVRFVRPSGEVAWRARRRQAV